MEATKTYSRDEVLHRIGEERAWWEGVVNAGDASAMTPPLKPGHWSFRDVIEHLNVWQRSAIDQLIATRNGQSPPHPWPAELDLIEDKDNRTDQKNAWFQERDRDQSSDEVTAISRDLLAELSDFVAATAPQELNNPFQFKSLEGRSLAGSIVSGAFFRHIHDEHADDLKAWLDGEHSRSA